MPARKPLKVEIVEQFIQSKTGRMEDCEDRIHISDHFIAVIDGATEKSDYEWGTDTPGRMIGEIIDRVFGELEPDSTLPQAIEAFNAEIQVLYQKHDVLEKIKKREVEPGAATLCALSLARREVWIVGDCQVLIDDRFISPPKKTDEILSSVRALYLELEMARGKTVEELVQLDTGREYILPLLRGVSVFQNDAESPYGYGVVNGFEIPAGMPVIEQICDDVQTIVLASDGYPELRRSLNESEKVLQTIQKHYPLATNHYSSTKGLSVGNLSFDDRGFIHVKIL